MKVFANKCNVISSLINGNNDKISVNFTQTVNYILSFENRTEYDFRKIDEEMKEFITNELSEAKAKQNKFYFVSLYLSFFVGQ